MTHRKGYLSVSIAFLELGSTFCGIIMCCCGFMGGLMCLPIFDLLGSSLAGKGYLCVCNFFKFREGLCAWRFECICMSLSVCFIVRGEMHIKP